MTNNSLVTAQDGTARPIIIENPIQVAKELIQKKSYPAAITILTALLNANGAESQFYYLETNMLLARLYVALGQNEQAIGLYETVLSIDVKNTAANIELANVYRLIGDHKKAKQYLSTINFEGLSESLTARISAYYQAIRNDSPWQYNLSFSLAPDTNINAATEDEIVQLFGFNFALSEDARKTSGLGGKLGGAIMYKHQVNAKVDWDFNLNGQYTYYPEYHQFNQATIVFNSGPRLKTSESSNANFYARSYIQLYGDEKYSSGLGFETSYRKKISTKTLAQISLLAESVKNEFDPFRDGFRYSSELAVRHKLSTKGFWSLATGVSIEDVKSNALSNNVYKLNLGVYYQISHNVAISLSPYLSLKRHHAKWLVFDKKREDIKTAITIEAVKDDLKIGGLTPIFSFLAERNFSNIDLFTYTRFRPQISLRKAF